MGKKLSRGGKFKETDEFTLDDIFISKKVRYNIICTICSLPDEMFLYLKEYKRNELNDLIKDNFYTLVSYPELFVMLKKRFDEKDWEDFILSNHKNQDELLLIPVEDEKVNNAILNFVQNDSSKKYYLVTTYLLNGRNKLMEEGISDLLYEFNYSHYRIKEEIHLALQFYADRNIINNLLQIRSLYLKRNHPDLYKQILDFLKIRSDKDLEMYIATYGIREVFWSSINKSFVTKKIERMIVKEIFRTIRGPLTQWSNVPKIFDLILALDFLDIKLINHLGFISKEISKDYDRFLQTSLRSLFKEERIDKLFEI